MGVVQLLVLLVIGAVLLPPFRQVLINVGVIMLGACLLVGIIAFGVFLIRRTEHKSPLDSCHSAGLEMPPQPRAMKPKAMPASTPNLLDQLRSIDWFQFEKLVALVYRKLGYSVTRRGGANPDGGVDLVIEKDGRQTAVQCKQWKTWNVGVKAVREFLGALTDAGIRQGIFITLCGYTGEAKQLAGKHGIEIVDEAGLARMIEQADACFDPEALAILRDRRKFCPKCESEMALRTASKGAGAGQQFWGCSAYPRCRFTLPAK